MHFYGGHQTWTQTASEWIPLLLLVALFLPVNGWTLRQAIRTRRAVIRSGENHGSLEFASKDVRNKATLLGVQIVAVCWRCLRIVALSHPEAEWIWPAFNVLCLLMSVGVAWCAWENMRAFEEFKSQQ